MWALTSGPPLHLINGCVRKQPPFQAPQTFQNKQLLLSGLLSIRAAAEAEHARARSLFPLFRFSCNRSFPHFISNLSVRHSDNHLVFRLAIVVHLKLMPLSFFWGNPFIYMTNVVLNYCKSIQNPLKRSMTASGGIMLWMSEIYNALGIFSADWYVVFCWSLLL